LEAGRGPSIGYPPRPGAPTDTYPETSWNRKDDDDCDDCVPSGTDDEVFSTGIDPLYLTSNSHAQFMPQGFYSLGVLMRISGVGDITAAERAKL
jgi:hypothetical protein